jgi:hypothetical protein
MSSSSSMPKVSDPDANIPMSKDDKISIWPWMRIRDHLDLLSTKRFTNQSDLRELVVAIKALDPTAKINFLQYIRTRAGGVHPCHKLLCRFWDTVPDKISTMLIGVILRMLDEDGVINGSGFDKLLCDDLIQSGKNLSKTATVHDMAIALDSALAWRVIAIQDPVTGKSIIAAPLTTVASASVDAKSNMIELRNHIAQVPDSLLDNLSRVMLSASCHSERIDKLAPLVSAAAIPILSKSIYAQCIEKQPGATGNSIKDVEEYVRYAGAMRRGRKEQCIEAEKLVKMLSADRKVCASNREMLAAALSHIDDDLQPLFYEWCEEYDQEPSSIWMKSHTDMPIMNIGMTMLHTWASGDNPIAYAEFINQKRHKIAADYVAQESQDAKGIALALLQLCSYRYFTVVTETGVRWGEIIVEYTQPGGSKSDELTISLHKPNSFPVSKECSDFLAIVVQAMIVAKFIDTDMDEINKEADKAFDLPVMQQFMRPKRYCNCGQSTCKNPPLRTMNEALQSGKILSVAQTFTGVTAINKLKETISGIVSSSPTLVPQARMLDGISWSIMYNAYGQSELYSFGVFMNKIPAEKTIYPATILQRERKISCTISEAQLMNESIISLDDLVKEKIQDAITADLVITLINAVKKHGACAQAALIDIITDTARIQVAGSPKMDAEMVFIVAKGSDSPIIPTALVQLFDKEQKEQEKKAVSTTMEKIFSETNISEENNSSSSSSPVSIDDINRAIDIQSKVHLISIDEKQAKALDMKSVSDFLNMCDDAQVYFQGMIGALEMLQMDCRQAVTYFGNTLAGKDNSGNEIPSRSPELQAAISKLTSVLGTFTMPEFPVRRSVPITSIGKIIDACMHNGANCSKVLQAMCKCKASVSASQHNLITHKKKLEADASSERDM